MAKNTPQSKRMFFFLVFFVSTEYFQAGEGAQRQERWMWTGNLESKTGRTAAAKGRYYHQQA